MKETKKVKKSALCFTDEDCFARLTFADEEPKFEMTAYSGGIIKDHWYWGNVAFDLKGVKIPKGATPILEEHDITRKIGIAFSYSTQDNKLSVSKASILKTDAAKEFSSLSEQGFPFQASIRGRPSRIEFVEQDAFSDVNGYKFTGPGHIWREWELKESSVCVFGADANTSSKTHFAEEEELEIFVDKIEKQGEEKMEMFDMEKFKLEQPDAFNDIEKSIREKVVTEMEDKFSHEQDKSQATIADMTAKIDSYQNRFADMEQKMAVAKAKEMKLEASKIFADKFAAAELSENLFTKLEKLVPYTDYVKENELDVTAYSDALSKEFTEWKSIVPQTAVQGSGTQQKKVSGDQFTDEAADTLVDEMLKLVGK